MTTFCQRCGVEAPTKQVAFRQNIGAVFIRFHSTCQGELCKSCIHAEFWKRSLINCVGWFGTISFVVAPIFLIMNVYNYATAATLPPPQRGARTPDNDPAAIRRLAKVINAFALRFNSGEPFDRVVADLCRAADVTTGQAHVFLRMITDGRLAALRPAPMPTAPAP